jgi:hypothetical protein
MIEFLIAAVPLLALLVSLLLGHYLGHEAAMRLAERFAARARPRTTVSSSSPRPWPPASHAARGGQLIAFGLAQRPPPLAA